MARCSGLFVRPGTQDAKFLVFYLCAFKTISLFYTMTLHGGDVKFITDRLALYGGIIILSSISALCLTVFPMTKFQTVNVLTKILSLSLGWWIFLDVALSDMNTTLQSHGQYNLLMFSILFIAGFFLSIVIIGCGLIRAKLTPCQFWGAIWLFLVFFLIWWIELSRQARVDWTKGLSSVNLKYTHENCDIVLPGTPWAAIIPSRTFNFYLSTTCPVVEKFATLKNHTLTIKCKEKEARIIELPDFLTPHTDAFILDENGLTNWKNTSKSLEKSYKVPGFSTHLIYSEYFQVFCNGQENFFVQNTMRENITEKLENYEVPRMNLLMFQIDTLSRAHFIRRMVETVKTLEELNNTESYEVFQTFRLTTIGYNTEINTKALYTGSQFRQGRGGRPLWSIFSKQNSAVLYLNGFCEDWSSRFLKKMPSGMDYFVFKPWCHPEYTPVNRTFSNFDGVNSMRRRCINGEYVHNLVFNYLKDFWKNHENYGKMVLAPMQESHEASMDVISTLDPSLSRLLKWYKDSGELNRTIIIITSDHGSHMSLYYIFSQVGKLEHKLPELFMIFPKWFLDKYPHIRIGLQENEQRLITHYDTHWAIVSLSQLPEFGGTQEKIEDNQFVHVWDCRKNEKYIKDIWYFRGKTFYNTDALENFERTVGLVFEKISQCIHLYDSEEPDEDPMVHATSQHSKVNLANVPPCESEKCFEITVFDVIKSSESYFWLLDALEDLKDGNRPEDIVYSYASDISVFDTFKAPGCGRYRLGQSLFHYWENKTCEDTGSVEWCACANKK